jgi:hypothetical protein
MDNRTNGELDLGSLLSPMPDPTPDEMVAVFDPATWAFSKALFKTLVSKGLFTVGDLLQMHADILKTAQSFGDAGEVQREEAVNQLAEWLEQYAGSLGQP